MASILRTGKFLRYFAGFTRNVVVNSVRDTENGSLLQTTPSLCIQFQHGFANSVAAPSADLSLDKQIKRLDEDVRRIGRISRRDIEDVLEEIRVTRSATSSQSLLVIRCCGNLVPEEIPEVRTALVQEIWKTLNALNVPMDISHYNALLRVYLENEHQFSPTDFLAEIEAKSIEPNRVTYQRLIARYCQQGDIEGATRILEYMRGKSLPVNEAVFNSLIIGHSQANDMDSAKGILGVMKQAGLEPSADTYTTLLCCFARHGDIESINSTLAECEKKDILLLDKDLLDVVYHLTINGHGDKIDDILGKFHFSTGFNQDCVNTILRLTNKGFEDVCLKLLRVMPRGTRSDGMPVDVGIFFIRQLVKANRPVEKILSVCKALQDEGLNSRPLLIATEAGLTHGMVNSTLPLLTEMKNAGLPIRQHYFWPLICAVEHNQIFDILRKMQEEFNLQPTAETVREYVIPNLKEKNWDKIITSLRDVGVSNGTAATAATYTALTNGHIKEAANIMEKYTAIYHYQLFRQPLLQAFRKTQSYDAFVRCLRQLYESARKRHIQTSSDSADNNAVNSEQINDQSESVSETDVSVKKTNETFDVVGEMLCEMTSYFRTDCIPILEKLLPKLVQEGFTISSHNAVKLSENIGSDMTANISELLGKLSSGELELSTLNNTGKKRGIEHLTVEELERFIANVEAKGENSNNIKRHLLAACFRSKNLEKTLQVIDRLETEEYPMGSGVWAQLIELYTTHERVSDALNTYEKIKTKDAEFSLDNSKTVGIVELLLKEERFEEALKFLEKNKKLQNASEGDINYNYTSKVWRILNAFAESGDAEKLQKIFDAFVQGNYVIPNNILLGALIKVHLVNDNVLKAIEVFEKICEEYKATPWKNELARRLIQSEDATNLQKITDLSTNIHGEINSLYDLVFSFVECGRIRQARKILETPGLRTRHHRIDSACERYKNEGKVEPLEGLVEATRDLSHIDRNKIYYSLLQSYCKSKDGEKALGLWTKMQEENVTPDDKFLVKLAELLESMDMTVPFVVPQVGIQSARNVKIGSENKVAEEPTKTLTTTGHETQHTRAKSNLSLLRKSLHNNDLNAVLKYKDNLKAQDQLTTFDLSNLVEKMVQAGQLSEATKYVNELLAKNTLPVPKIFKFYLNRIANTGDLETLTAIGKQISNEQKRLVSFDNRFCHANIVAGKADQYLNDLCDQLAAAKTTEEVAKLADEFPRGGALGILEKHPELIEKFKKLAEDYVKYNQYAPMNILWIHYISHGDEAASKKIWDEHLSSASRLMFQRVLQTAREQNNDMLVQSVINQLRGSKISEGAIGNAYSCLIDIQTAKGNTDKAFETLKIAIKDVCLEHINRTALLRLKSAMETEKKEFPFAIPEKKYNTGKSLSSSSSSQSSDDDVTPKRPETKPTKPAQKDE